MPCSLPLFNSSSGSSTSNDMVALKCLKRTKSKSKGRKKKARKTQQEVTVEAEIRATDLDENIKDSGMNVSGELDQQQSPSVPKNEQNAGAENAIVEAQFTYDELDVQLKGIITRSYF